MIVEFETRDVNSGGRMAFYRARNSDRSKRIVQTG